MEDKEKMWCPIARAVCVDGYVEPTYMERYPCAMTMDGECLPSEFMDKFLYNLYHLEGNGFGVRINNADEIGGC